MTWFINPRSTYIYRVQTESGVFRTIDPPPPLHPASVSSPRIKGGGVHTRRAVRGWGVKISEDARHWIGLLQYNSSTYKPIQPHPHYPLPPPHIHYGAPIKLTALAADSPWPPWPPWPPSWPSSPDSSAATAVWFTIVTEDPKRSLRDHFRVRVKKSLKQAWAVF
jgi:hypothetical protein